MDNDIMRRQVEEQRQTINTLIRVVNYHSHYMDEYRKAHDQLFKRRLYLFMMWLQPVMLPLFRKMYPIRVIGRPDDIPILLPSPLHNGVAVEFDINNPVVFADEFVSGVDE